MYADAKIEGKTFKCLSYYIGEMAATLWLTIDEAFNIHGLNHILERYDLTLEERNELRACAPYEAHSAHAREPWPTTGIAAEFKKVYAVLDYLPQNVKDDTLATSLLYKMLDKIPADFGHQLHSCGFTKLSDFAKTMFIYNWIIGQLSAAPAEADVACKN